jgi:hypothetical protein
MHMNHLGTALAVAVLVTATQSANVSFVLTLDDISTVGIDVIISDDQFAGFATSVGATTSNDALGGAGAVSYSGSVGSFIVNVTTGISKPLVGPGIIDLNSLNVSGGAGTLSIGLTDTGFTGSFGAYRANFGGTTQGSVDLDFLYDAANAEFGGLSFSNPPSAASGAFSGSETGAVIASDPYSLTILADIVHTNAGKITSFDAEASPVPVPATAWLLGSGILGFTMVGRRRRK